MAKLYRNNRAPLGNKITLVAGNSLPIKVEGLGSNRRHIVLKSRNPQLLTVSAVQVNDRMLEQSLRIEVRRDGIVTSQRTFVDAFLNDGTPTLTKKDQTTAPLEVEVLPEIRLPADSTEVGMLTRMLLVENITPGLPGYSSSEVEECMKWMRFVFINRMQLGSEFFGAGKNINNLVEFVKAPNQVEGFSNYPKLSTVLGDNLARYIAIANDGTHVKNKAFRDYIALAVATARLSESELGKDPCTTKLYAWRTSGAASPGKNFVLFSSKGGQDFYTLTEFFIKDSGKGSK
ncbi:hypothetical protein QCD60_08685 [Pokkaliibacter sp. MBI-7]|uniref:hypothetical protein n=1 Tax=Pokkaliibacter sp. MBI-7 TaxID=3040600 RepID=UPI00244A38B5|nr:hypothetical protein [Pokkaliibacter sp. MBI-7]MDH2432642.1 hypothetical protein [Pokkaliibacter sp. MBI-7]